MSRGAVDHASFTSHYEALRAWATVQPRPVTRPAGLVLVLRYGVPAWLASWSTWLSSAGRAASTVTSGTEPAVGKSAVAAVLASMVEHCRQEAQR